MGKRYLNCDFEVKRKGSGQLVIEGYANAATVDRMQERIDPKGWNLDNYKKNPVILFDHGHDPAFGFMPVGRAVAVDPQEEGLYTKCIISSSSTEKIGAVRDLVEEGILKTFSVGFDPKDETKDGEVKVITQAELIEISIVPIPMNQDSTFSVLSKHFRSGNAKAKKWFESYVQRTELVKKGAYTAALLHQRMGDLIEMGGFDRDAALRYVGDKAGVSMGELKGILSGEITPVPDGILKAFAEVLRVDPNFLINMDKNDVALLERARKLNTGEEKAMPGIDVKEGAPLPKEEEEPKKEEDEKAGESKGQMVLHAVKVPKEVYDDAELAATFISDHGYAADKVTEDDKYWIFEQLPADGLDTDNGSEVELGDGIMAYVCPKKGEGLSDDKPEDKKPVEEGKALKEDAEAEGDIEDKPEGEVAAPPSVGSDLKVITDEDIKKAIEEYKAEKKAVESDGKGGGMPKWVADKDRWNKAKELAKGAGAGELYGFTVWAYLNLLEGGKKSGVVPVTKEAMDTSPPPDQNQYLELAKQTNVLLGGVIQEIQKMSAKLDGIAEVPKEEPKPPQGGEQPPAKDYGKVDEEDEDDEEVKSLIKDIRNTAKSVETGLKRLGV